MSARVARTSGTALSIGQLARTASIGVNAIRFYERSGLLPTPRRRPSGYRVYGSQDVDRLGFIRRAQSFGFTLEEIALLLRSRNERGGVAATKALAEQKLAALEAKATDLLRLKSDLKALVSHCPGNGEAVDCPILDAFTTLPKRAPGSA